MLKMAEALCVCLFIDIVAIFFIVPFYISEIMLQKNIINRLIRLRLCKWILKQILQYIETKYLGTNKINVPWAPAGKLARQ